MNEKPGLEPGFFARRATGGLTGYALLRQQQRHTGAMVVAVLAGLVLSTILCLPATSAPIIAHAGFDAFYFA
jgi:hypothetical protein